MAKFLQNGAKAKKKKQKNGGLFGFICGMIIYALVFLTALTFGLREFWDYIAAYEQSRPKLAIETYMEQLTVEHMCDASADLIAQIDHNIQSEEECRQVIRDAISGEITYAKKTSECTDTKQVYVLRSGKQVIGSFSIAAQEADEYGFTPWQVTEESFDFSFLIGETVSTTVPAEYPVYVNDVQLDSSYVVEEETINYDVLEEFYDDYDLPTFTKLTYTAGPFLGNFEMEVTDVAGNPAVFDENTDINFFVDNCSDEEIKELDEFINEFIKRYVTFTGSANRARYDNYDKLVAYIVPGTMLQTRMHDAIEGLYFAQSRGDSIASITVNHYINIGDDRYICDVTYLVDTTGLEGVVQTTNNVKIVLVETADGLKAEAMTSY